MFSPRAHDSISRRTVRRGHTIPREQPNDRSETFSDKFCRCFGVQTSDLAGGGASLWQDAPVD